MISKGVSYHVARSNLDRFEFGDCVKCKATIIRARVKTTQTDQIFDPQPTGGSEIDPTYSVHVCPSSGR